MPQAHLFEIGYRPGVPDPAGRGLKHDIAHLGLAAASQVQSAQLYSVAGKLSEEERTRIAQDLLCDPILNESRHASTASKGKAMVIDVWYKAGVTDVVGDSVRKGIEDLGIKSVQEVRTGMRYHLQGVTRKDAAEKIALALLVNPLIHDVTVHAD